MSTQAMAEVRVADLTVAQLKGLIRDTVAKVLQEFLRDPDAGLELQPAVEEELRHAITYEASGGKMLSLKELTARLESE